MKRLNKNQQNKLKLKAFQHYFCLQIWRLLIGSLKVNAKLTHITQNFNGVMEF